jgi:hypothetical protein
MRIDVELPNVKYREDDTALLEQAIRRSLSSVLFDGDAQPLPMTVKFKGVHS